MFANHIEYLSQLFADGGTPTEVIAGATLSCGVLGGVFALLVISSESHAMRPRTLVQTWGGWLACMAAVFFIPMAVGLAVTACLLGMGIVSLALCLRCLPGWIARATYAVVANLDEIPSPESFQTLLVTRREEKASNRSLSRTGSPGGCPDTALSRSEE